MTPESNTRVGLANCRVALRILSDDRKAEYGGIVRLSEARLETAKRSAMRVLNRQVCRVARVL